MTLPVVAPPAIQTVGLEKRYGNFVAVHDLNLTVKAGTVFGFLGPNGAGKTTTLKMLTGLLRPTAGVATVAGFDVATDPMAVKARIGVVPETLALYERLTALEYLELVGRLHGLDAATIQTRRKDLLGHLNLADQARSYTLDFSTGMRKKLALAAALISNPQILFLDEPFEGVDAISARTIKDILRTLVDRRGVTVFFSTHIMELVERLCDEVAILDHGQLVAQGDLPSLRAQAKSGGDASLEEVFLALVDARPQGTADMDWL